MNKDTIDLLHHAPQHIDDREWLQRHSAELYQGILEGLKQTRIQQQAVKCLVVIFPHMLQRDDLREWTNLLKQAQKALNSNITDETILHPIYIVPARQHKPLYTNRQRKRTRISPGQLAEIYLSVLLASRNDPDVVFNGQTVDALMRFTQFFNETYDIFKIYQIIAYIMNKQGEHQRALGMLDLVGNYFNDQQHLMEAGLQAYARAKAHEGIGNTPKARHYLQHAIRALEEAGYTGQAQLARLDLKALDD